MEKKAAPPRPDMPALNELSLNGDELVAKFIEEITTQTGVVHRAADTRSALASLRAIFQAEEISTVMVSNADVVSALNLPAWGKKTGLKS